MSENRKGKLSSHANLEDMKKQILDLLPEMEEQIAHMDK